MRACVHEVSEENTEMNLCYALPLFTLILVTDSNEVKNYCFAEECPGTRVAALVPARGGSKGIKRKNLSRIGNDTLISRTLRALHKSGQFESVWVSTDDGEIAEEASRHGAGVHWRDPATATDSASTVSAVQDFLLSHKDLDVLAVIQCTSPFLRPEFLTGALQKMMSKQLDCIFSATRVYHLRWTYNEDGFVRPLNFDPGARPRRQDWNGEIIENGMFYFAKVGLITNGALQNKRCDVWVIPQEFSLDIDTEMDLNIARKISDLIDNLVFG